MKLNRIGKIATLATLLVALESNMNQDANHGATDSNSFNHDIQMVENSLFKVPKINTPGVINDSIESVLDTISFDYNSIISKDLLRSYIFMYSQNKIDTTYNSIDAVLDTLRLDSSVGGASASSSTITSSVSASFTNTSSVIDKDFLKLYIHTRIEEQDVYDAKQLEVRKILDTIPFNAKFLDRVGLSSFAFVESHYTPNAYNPYSGASGVMQLMPITYKDNGEGKFILNRFNAEKNIRAGINYILWLENNIPKNYDKNMPKNKKWKTLSADAKIDFIAAAYNAGHVRLYNKNFDLKKMPKETILHLAKIKDARLIVTLDDLTDFTKPMVLANYQPTISGTNHPLDTINGAQRILEIAKTLESVETYLSKNYAHWKNADIDTKQELIIAASTYGPRMFIEELNNNRGNPDWNFRYLKSVASRINDFNDKKYAKSMDYAWNYSGPSYIPGKNILFGIEQLQSLEKQLMQNYYFIDTATNHLTNWGLGTDNQRRNILTAAVISGYSNLKNHDFNVQELSESDRKKIDEVNNAFLEYNKRSQFRARLLTYANSSHQNDAK